MIRPILLITDLDGTLLGHAAALDLFRAWFVDNRAAVKLVYATGRTVADVCGLVQRDELPAPDHVIGSVGTEILDFESGAPHADWLRRANPSWNVARVRRELDRFPELELQRVEFQSERKVSFFLDNASPDQLGDITAALSTACIPADVIYSGNRFIDVLPRGMNKGTAADYLARGLDFDRADIIACGDSGNDLPMFLQNIQSVLVANAEESVVRLAAEPLYHSPYGYAAGVLDGIRHWLSRHNPSSGLAMSLPDPDSLHRLAGATRVTRDDPASRRRDAGRGMPE